MITTSRWVFHVNNRFMKEDLTLQIELQEDGGYLFYAVTKEGLRPFPQEAAEKAAIEGDTLKAVVENPDAPFMKVEIVVEFGEETANGYFKLPILGKLKFGGERLELTELPIIDEEITTEEAKEKLSE